MRILKHLQLPYCQDGYTWFISPYSGSLIRERRARTTTRSSLPDKVAQAMSYCTNPYLCESDETSEKENLAIDERVFKRLNHLHRILVHLGNRRFFLARHYANYCKFMFGTTADSMRAIARIGLQKEEKGSLCLQRTLLAVKTAKSFQDSGVLFIGAFLPTTNMHAWIIENGAQPDPQDREWILYRPLLALYYDNNVSGSEE